MKILYGTSLSTNFVQKSIDPLKQASDYVSLDVLNTIYKSLIQPVFDYCDVVWDNLARDLPLGSRNYKIVLHA